MPAIRAISNVVILMIFLIAILAIYTVRGLRRETGLSAPVKYFTDPSKEGVPQGGTHVVDHLCFVFLMHCWFVHRGHLLGKR